MLRKNLKPQGANRPRHPSKPAFDDLVSGRRSSLRAIAKAEGVTDRYIAHILPLAFLAPDIVESVIEGTQPEDLTLERLVKYTDLPLAWADQKALLGFTSSR